MKLDFSYFTEEEQALIKKLIANGQTHLFQHWSESEEDFQEKKAQVAQLKNLDNHYPGGLLNYISNAKKLLHESKEEINPYDNFSPEIPVGIKLKTGSEDFVSLENKGIIEAGNTAYALVAGGLGERLGYSGIKIALPSEICTQKSFIQLYIENIIALQLKSERLTGESSQCELAIMTSDDTHDLTVTFLTKNSYFGLDKKNIHFLKQEKVPGLKDNNASFSQNKNNLYEIETKPHGHGDIHALLHQHNILDHWKNLGKKWIVFFQDTNGQVFNAIPATLGVSKSNNYEVNSITVPRRAGEAAGGIVKLSNSKQSMTINVEYNQLDPLLKANGQPEGDVPDKDGKSPYPGNINVLVFNLEKYRKNLQKTGGAIPEFINPKYADQKKETFKKTTRLECMMQDYPKLLAADAKVGFTQFDRLTAFSAVKNNLIDAAKRQKDNVPVESASTGENDLYQFNRQLLKQLDNEVSTGEQKTFGNIEIIEGPKIVFSPLFKNTYTELKNKIKNCKISTKSTLIIDADNLTIENLSLDGTLIIKAVAGAEVHIKNLEIKNDGWHYTQLEGNENEGLAIRGYKLSKMGQKELVFKDKGKFIVDKTIDS